MLLSLFNLVQAQQTTQYHFFVTLPTLTDGVVNGQQQASLTFTWAWDSCAGALDSVGRPVQATSINGFCVYNTNLQVLNQDPAKLFPNGLQTLELRQGFGTTSQTTSLLPATNNAAFATSKTFTISGINSRPTGYYVISMTAIDGDGNFVAGQSAPFGILNGGTLPPRNAITFVSPLKGSLWGADAEYRVRWQVDPSRELPETYSLDLVTPNNELTVYRIKDRAFPIFPFDTVLGTQNPCNYTVWKIPASLQNKKFRLKLVGNFASGQTLNATSDVFFIGPAK
ncbi:hypothetical protein EDD86DRAFT_188100 [Gorgonomyces haynaldii]|nr:hypothetical protein EDD86DRAFT_188100 [Gorgonomyces haynaldii]